MQLPLQYVTNDTGEKLAVQISLKVWEEHWEEFLKLKQAYTMKQNLTQAFQEIKEIHEGKREKITLEEFLHDC